MSQQIDDTGFVAKLADSLATEPGSPPFFEAPNSAAASCIASTLVEAFGVAMLVEMNVTTEIDRVGPFANLNVGALDLPGWNTFFSIIGSCVGADYAASVLTSELEREPSANGEQADHCVVNIMVKSDETYEFMAGVFVHDHAPIPEAQRLDIVGRFLNRYYSALADCT